MHVLFRRVHALHEMLSRRVIKESLSIAASPCMVRRRVIYHAEGFEMKVTLFAILIGFTGCAVTDSSSPQPMSYDEFRGQAYFQPETGTYVINGDELVSNDKQMREVYDAYVDSFVALQAAKDGFGETQQGLIVNTVNGADDKWNAAGAARITYCINSTSFGSNYALMKSAMHDATRQWERIGKFNFIRLIDQDGAGCTNTNNNVVFNVRQVTGQPFLARAFFPSSTRAERELQIDSSSFEDMGVYTIRGVLRHELGHTLGFRHEHTRPEAGTCFENSEWRALTNYDAQSVMHYPQCNGGNTGNLRLTDLDKTGAALLYPGVQPQLDTANADFVDGDPILNQ